VTSIPFFNVHEKYFLSRSCVFAQHFQSFFIVSYPDWPARCSYLYSVRSTRRGPFLTCPLRPVSLIFKRSALQDDFQVKARGRRFFISTISCYDSTRLAPRFPALPDYSLPSKSLDPFVLAPSRYAPQRPFRSSCPLSLQDSDRLLTFAAAVLRRFHEALPDL